MCLKNLSLFVVLILIAGKIGLVLPECVHGDLYSHDTSCEHFYQCVHGELIELKCRYGLFFNPNINVCDYPENVMCEFTTDASTVTEIPTTTELPTTGHPTDLTTTTERHTTTEPPTTTELSTTTEVPTTTKLTTTTEVPSCSTEAGVHWHCEEDGSRWAYDCDFPGYDIKSVFVSMEECARICRETAGCTRYTWSGLASHYSICFVKDSPNYAIYEQHGGICGYI